MKSKTPPRSTVPAPAGGELTASGEPTATTAPDRAVPRDKQAESSARRAPKSTNAPQSGESAMGGSQPSGTTTRDHQAVPIKTPVTLAKIVANRDNAKYSTGPVTPAGKQTVSRNSTTHGLLGRGPIPEIDGPDAQERFDRLVNAVNEQYGPFETYEEARLGSDIVNGIWEADRAGRVLDAAIRRGATRKKRRMAKACAATPLTELRALANPESLLDTAPGVAAVLAAVDQVRQGVAQQGELTPEARVALTRMCADSFVKLCLADVMPATETAATTSPAAGPAQLLVRLEAECERLRSLHTELINEEANAIIASALPGKLLDRCQRYGTGGERRAERARARLEYVQARRRGERVPPTVRLQINRG